MKITKVNGARIGVVNSSVDKTGVILYHTNSNKGSEDVKAIVENRIKDANDLYSVFFKGTQVNGETVKKLPNGLENVFSKLMKKMELQYKKDIVAAYIGGSKEKCIQKQIEWLKAVSDVKNTEEVKSAAINVDGENTKKENKIKEPYKVDFAKLKWDPVDEEVLEKSFLRVRKSLKRGSDRWIIKRIIIALSKGSQKEYLEEIEALETEHKAKLEHFIDSVNKDYHKTNLLKSLKNHNVKVQVNKNALPKELKEKFAWLMWEVENRFKKKILEYYKDREKNKEEISKLVKDQLGNLIGIKEIQKVEWDATNHKYISKQSVSFEALEDCYIANGILDNMEIPLVDELKKDENNEVVKAFIKAMASGTKEEYNKKIKEYRINNGEKLENYVDSLNEYYFSLWRDKLIYKKKANTWIYDVENKGESILNLANISNSHGNKSALTGILEKYAFSEEDANDILLELKKVFLEYFFNWDGDKLNEFLLKENLWKIPNEKIQSEGYFDEGFQAAEEYLDAEQQKVPKAIEELMAETEDDKEKIRWGAVRARVRFVNCGKYLQMMNEDRNEREKFWITYVKEYIDENYVDVGKKKKNNKKELYQKISMFKECWSDAINYLCGKYIDIGKAVYHFAMPENISLDEKEYGVVRKEYQKGISSFDYETIKAEETLQRDVATATVAALAAFSRSVTDTDYSGKDVLFTKDEDTVIKEDALRQILRYFGGINTVKEVFDKAKSDSEIESQLVSEIKSHFNLIRNENFHYTAGKIGAFSCDNVLKLWENDRKVYGQIIRQKYYSNNVSMFYDTDKIQKLVSEFYGKKAGNRQANVFQATAFKNVLHKKDLSSFIEDFINKKSAGWTQISCDDSIRIKYEGALYFLLKEIYYNEFVCSMNACNHFYAAVKTYNGTENINNSNEAAKNFSSYVEGLENENLSLGQICQRITQEYNQQNTKGEEENYKHFKMLLPLCIKQAFKSYLIQEKQEDSKEQNHSMIHEKYVWLRTPGYNETEGEQTYLDQTTIECGVTIEGAVNEPDEKRRIAWYTFAHFVHPKQLNLLIGDFKSYIQYREDIIRRAGCAKQYGNKDAGKKMKASVNRAKLVLEVLEFVRVLSGRETGNFEDYYKDADEYSRYLSRYIDFSQNEKPSFVELKEFCQNLNIENDKFDILLDDQNPKVVRNIEYARMYGGGDVAFKGFKKISGKEIEEYYKGKNSNTSSLANRICETKEQQQKVIKQQQLKGRIMLNEVMDSFSMVNDMMGRLVSLAYLRERDKMYLLLGYYYMALRNPANTNMNSLNVTITQKNKENNENKEETTIAIEKGAILYQLVGVFDYGTPALLYENNKWILNTRYSIGKREKNFTTQYNASKTCAMQLFQNVKEENEKGNKNKNKNKGKDSDTKNPPKMHWETIQDLRNSVDHLKYYRDPEQSIWELYSEFYQKFFRYSKKLRKSVLSNFCNVLDDYCLKAEISFDAARKPLLGNITSTKYKYKLNAVDENGKQAICVIDAKSETFCNNTKAVLKYSNTNNSPNKTKEKE